MQITFNANTYVIRHNAEGLLSLTDIEKAWRDSGGSGGQLRNWLTSDDYKRMSSEIQKTTTRVDWPLEDPDTSPLLT
ncbi:hypothetical protein [Aeromonas caviae]|uniref:hypothetical protein n=1 Tax=Aeromonas caviae TaxID=648 RepID=UPI002B490948|nr:hypothetical protein [Aeromonas caviae]